jgi:hypothetical protein
VKQRVQNWPGREADQIPVVRKRSIRTLIARDERQGRTMPEFGRITDQKGVDTGSGFAASPNIVRSTKRDPQPTGSGRTVVKKANLGPLQKRSRGT